MGHMSSAVIHRMFGRSGAPDTEVTMANDAERAGHKRFMGAVWTDGHGRTITNVEEGGSPTPRVKFQGQGTAITWMFQLGDSPG